MRLHLLALTVILLGGCVSNSEAPKKPGQEIRRLKLHFTPVRHGHWSQVEEKKTILVKSYGELLEMWLAINGEPWPKNFKPAPEMIVNSEEAMVATFMGAQPTGGYATRITGLWLNSKNQLEVQIVETHPHPNNTLLQAEMHPFHVVKVESCCLKTFKRLDGKHTLVDTVLKVRPIQVKIRKE